MKQVLNEILAEIVSTDSVVNQFIDEFRKGFRVELEHSETVNNNMFTIARIALDHLEEDPEYYTKLLAAKL